VGFGGKRTITVEQAKEKRQKIGAFDSVERSALNGSGIGTMFDDFVSECKKCLKNELKEGKGGEIIDLRKNSIES
jgi:hypothetical protein